MNTGSRTHADVSLAEALAMGPPPPGNLAVPVYAHGSLEVEWYAPIGEDRQTPHDRDEVYVVARGSAVFFDGETRQPVAPGTFLFVAAGRAHRFEDLAPDFGVWVMFYGPVGGEAIP
jgi:mannose-6-phosphate isomerase-like protein (cupin superfamily)